MNPKQLEQLRIDTAAKRRPQRSILLIFVGVGVIAAVAAYFAWPRLEARRLVRGKKTLADAAERSAVVTSPATSAAPVTASTNRDAVLTVSGYIINRERIEVSPRIMGQVQWIGVRKGDTVTNNQVVVRLDDAEQRARLLEAQARIASAKIAIAKAELDYDRVLKLRAREVESRQTEDDLRLRVEAARAALQEVEGQVALLQTHLEWTVIRSPIDGVVLEKLVNPGELVMPQSFGGGRGPRTALIALADPKDLQVEVDLNEADLAKVRLGQACRVSPEAYPDRSYEAVVAERAPEANRQKGTLQLKVQIRHPDAYLTPELSAKVEFLRETAGRN